MAVKERMAELMEMPKEIILNYPKMTVTGKNEISVDNIIGIVEFSDKIIRLNTQTHILKICGYNLVIKSLTQDGVDITGEITSILLE